MRIIFSFLDFDICENEAATSPGPVPNDIQPSTSASCYKTADSSSIVISCPEQINILTEFVSKDIEMDCSASSSIENSVEIRENIETDFNFKVPTQTVPRSRKRKNPRPCTAKDKLKFKRLKARAKPKQAATDDLVLIPKPIRKEINSIYDLLAAGDDLEDDLRDTDIQLILSHFQISELIEPICDLELSVEEIVEPQSDLNYSPKSPPHCDISPDDEWTPKEILLTSIDQCSPIIDRLIKKSSVSPKQIPKIDFNDTKLIGKIRRLCEIYLTSEWTAINLKICITKLLKITNESKLLGQSILELIEDTDEPVNLAFTPPAPALPVSHQRLIVLVQKLAEFVPKLPEICLQMLERSIFTFKSTEISREALVNYTHFFIGLSDTIESPRQTIRLFIYKALYYMNHKAVPIIYTVLMAHPGVLPRFDPLSLDFNAEAILNQTDSLILSLQATLCDGRLYADRGISSVNAMKTAMEYKKKDLRYLLASYYNYSNDLFGYEKIVNCLIARIRGNQLKNCAYALILIGKKCGADWATKNIIDLHLMPMLHEFLGTIELCSDHDQQLSTILFTISSIIKTKDLSTDVSQLHQICLQILNATKRQMVQEAAVAALLRTNRFGVVNIYQKLCKWSPTFRLSRQLYGMLVTFVERKNRQFWRGHTFDEK